MKSIITIAIGSALTFATVSCTNNMNSFDASGSFEADEVVVSAEQSGKIIRFNIEEGQVLDSNSVIGQIDVSVLNIQKEETKASVNAIIEKVNNATPQVDILQSKIITQNAQVQTLKQQLAVLNKEVTRTQSLVNADAATQKQLDDITGQQSILKKQIAASQDQIGVLKSEISSAKANVHLQNRGILSEINPTLKKVDILDEQISRGEIKSPFDGTVLTKYAMAGEYASIGRPLYKIADLSIITLRAYITGNQLPNVKLNQKVKVHTDDGRGGFKETGGTIAWISDKAEFTPKTIQTKDERANLVYAIKVKVKNDGTYKIGMYGEIKF